MLTLVWRRGAGFIGGLVLLFLMLSGLGASAHAAGPSDPPASCFVANANGDLPTCDSADGVNWTVDYPDATTGGSGIPGAFVGVMVAVLMAGLIGTVFVVIWVRRAAREAGLDPDTATAVALLNNNAVSATYLASSVAKTRSPIPEASRPVPVSERLATLQDLVEKGVISKAEYEKRRSAILDTI